MGTLCAFGFLNHGPQRPEPFADETDEEESQERETGEKEEPRVLAETSILEGRRAGELLLRSTSPAYPNLAVEKDSFLIGKKKGAVDGLIKARGVSRIHGRITREEGGYYLSDLNSTNGTYLNGGRLEVNEKARIHPGDQVGFADVEYQEEIL